MVGGGVMTIGDRVLFWGDENVSELHNSNDRTTSCMY